MANAVVAKGPGYQPLGVVHAVSGEVGGALYLAATSLSSNSPVVGEEEVILRTDVKPYSWPDGTMGLIRSGAGYRFFAASAGYPKQSIGTLSDPQADGVTDVLIQHQKNPYHYAAGGPIYQDPASGLLLMVYHAERWIDPDSYLPFYSELGLAQSTDSGVTWTDLGPIISPHTVFEASYFQSDKQTFDVGGGGYVIIGDYWYVYFRDLLQEGQDYREVNFAVARARVRDVLAAAREGTTAALWTKYYDGAWAEPGLGGRSSSLLAGNGELLWGDVSYNAYLKSYISIAAGPPWPATDLYWAESKDGLQWTHHCRLVSDVMHKFYVTMVGLGDNPRETGQSFYMYYVRSRLYAQGGNRNQDAALVRRRIMLSDNTHICQ